MLLALPLIAAITLGAEARLQTPWFLPRYALIGGFGGNGVFVPTARIGWEIGVIEQRTDFVLLIEVGPGWSVMAPSNVSLFWEHTALIGVGVRTHRGREFYWGLSVLTGPVLEGARFKDGTPDEERWNGLIEGRAQAGIDLGPVSLAAYIGYSAPWLNSFHYPSTPFVGGLTFGVVLSWR